MSDKRETARISVPFRNGDVMEEFSGYMPIGLSEDEWAYMLDVLDAMKPDGSAPC